MHRGGEGARIIRSGEPFGNTEAPSWSSLFIAVRIINQTLCGPYVVYPTLPSPTNSSQFAINVNMEIR